MKTTLTIDLEVSKDQNSEYLFQELERQFSEYILILRQTSKVREIHRYREPFSRDGKPIQNNGFRSRSYRTIEACPQTQSHEFCKNCRFPSPEQFDARFHRVHKASKRY